VFEFSVAIEAAAARSVLPGSCGAVNNPAEQVSGGHLRARAASPRSYAAVWREGDGPTFTGKVELGATAVRFAGSAPQDGRVYVRELQYGSLAAVRIARAPEERLAERPTLVLECRTGGAIRVVGLNGVGLVGELAELLAALSSEAEESAQRLAVVLPLKKGAREQARRLIEEGPPFDPALSSLERHLVFLGERELVFLFEGDEARRTIGELLSRAGVLKTALAWRPFLAGPPRVLENLYSWTKTLPR